mmetsp:Transcript_42046/g.70154  ORF Transcript_42046/g.70154 Transcript_42046/m.70154 type:complete len:573 (-) Transcript_42046:364-2082(-)
MLKGQRVIVKGERGTILTTGGCLRRKIKIKFDSGDKKMVEKDSIELIEPRKDMAAIEARFEELRNRKVLVYWAGDEAWYPAKVVELLSQSGEFKIVYDDGEDTLHTYLDFSDYEMEPNGVALVWKPERLEKEQQGQHEHMKNDQDKMDVDESEDSDDIPIGKMRSSSKALHKMSSRSNRISRKENIAGKEDKLGGVMTNRDRNTGVHPKGGRFRKNYDSSSSVLLSSTSKLKAQHVVSGDVDSNDVDQHPKQLNKEKIFSNDNDEDLSDDNIIDLTKDEDSDDVDCIASNDGEEEPSSPEPSPTPPLISREQLKKGTKVEIWWHGDRRWYEGEIMHSPHKEEEEIVVHYKDGYIERESMRDRRGRICMRLMPKEKSIAVNQKKDKTEEKMDAPKNMIAIHTETFKQKGITVNQKKDKPEEKMDASKETITNHAETFKKKNAATGVQKGKMRMGKFNDASKQTKIPRKRLKIPKKAGAMKKMRTITSKRNVSDKAQASHVRSFSNGKSPKSQPMNFKRSSSGRNFAKNSNLETRKKVKSRFRIRSKALAPWVAVKLPENPFAPPMDPRPWRLK